VADVTATGSRMLSEVLVPVADCDKDNIGGTHIYVVSALLKPFLWCQ